MLYREKVGLMELIETLMTMIEMQKGSETSQVF